MQEQPVRVGWLLGMIAVLAALMGLAALVSRYQNQPRISTTSILVLNPDLSRSRDPVTGELRADEGPRELTEAALREESLRLCDQVSRELSQSAQAHALKANTLEQLGRSFDAEAAWLECLKRDPRSVAAYESLAELTMQRGENDKAIEWLRRLLREAEDYLPAYGMLVTVLLRSNHIDEAITAAKQALHVEPDSAWANYWAGQAYLQNHDYEKAKSYHQNAVQIDPEFGRSYHPLSIACAKLGDAEGSVRYRQRFAELKEQQLSRSREESRDYVDLPVQQDRLAELNYQIGNLWEDQGNARKAEDFWLRARGISSRHADARDRLVAWFIKQDRLADAVFVAEEIVTLQPDSKSLGRQTAQLMYQFASELHATGEILRAVDMLEKAGRLDPHNTQVRDLFEQLADVQK